MMNRVHRSRWFYLMGMVGLVGLDHVLKFWVCSHLSMYKVLWGWNGVFGLTRVRNYSLVNELGSRVEDSVRFILIWGVPVLLLSILLAVLAFRWQKQLQDRFDIGLGLLFFGGLSNVVLPLQGVGVIETLVFQLPFGLKVIYFNLADTMIWVGLAHILLNRAMKLDWASVFVGRRPRPISPLS